MSKISEIKTKENRAIDSQEVYGTKTICEIHTQITDILVDEIDDPRYKQTIDKVLDMLDTAFRMGKRMIAKMYEYKYGCDEGWWEQQTDMNAIEERRLRRLRKYAAEPGIKKEG